VHSRFTIDDSLFAIADFEIAGFWDLVPFNPINSPTNQPFNFSTFQPTFSAWKKK